MRRHDRFKGMSGPLSSKRGAEPRDGYKAFFEPAFGWLRSRRIRPYVRNGSSLLDVGCGKGELLSNLADLLQQGVGIDQRIVHHTSGNIRLQSYTIDATLPFPEGSFDAVTLLAVLEHLEKPEAVLREVWRILRPGGRALITVPTVYAKPVLEFLGFRLGLVSREGVADHKRYYTKAMLAGNLEQAGFAIERITYFELGFNLFAAAQKPMRADMRESAAI